MAITINGTTGISGVDGSTGTPAIIGSDADTGLVFAAGQVTASLNGTAANVALVSGTAQNSTSGTAIDFTGIPSWVKRITVMFNGVSTSGTSNKLIQLGISSGVVASGYTSSFGNGGSIFTATTGFGIWTQATTDTVSGIFTITNFSGNIWIIGGAAKINTANTNLTGGDITLSGTLDRVRITTVNGTDTFDAGSINIMYE